MFNFELIVSSILFISIIIILLNYIEKLKIKINTLEIENIKPTKLENKIEELEVKIKELTKLENKIRDLEDAIELKDF
jgi:hypothetical protein